MIAAAVILTCLRACSLVCLLDPGECDKRGGGGIAAGLARLTGARVARVCAQSRSPRTTETSHETGERLEPAASFGCGTCGRVDEGSREGSDVRGIVADGIRTDADGEQSGCVLALSPLLGHEEWMNVGRSCGVRERASVCGGRRGCSHPGACRAPLRACVLLGRERDRSRLYRLRTTRPALMPAVFWPLSCATLSLPFSHRAARSQMKCIFVWASIQYAAHVDGATIHVTGPEERQVEFGDGTNVFATLSGGPGFLNSSVNVNAPDFVTASGVSVDALGRRLEATDAATIASQQATIAALSQQIGVTCPTQTQGLDVLHTHEGYSVFKSAVVPDLGNDIDKAVAACRAAHSNALPLGVYAVSEAKTRTSFVIGNCNNKVNVFSYWPHHSIATPPAPQLFGGLDDAATVVNVYQRSDADASTCGYGTAAFLCPDWSNQCNGQRVLCAVLTFMPPPSPPPAMPPAAPPALPIISVGPSDDLQAVIDAASPNDIIELADGTYTSSRDQMYVIDKNLTIRAHNFGGVVIDGENTRQLFRLQGYETVNGAVTLQGYSTEYLQVTLEGLHLTRGRTGMGGGAAYIYGNNINIWERAEAWPTLILNHCNLTHHQSPVGGAILVYRGSLIVDSCNFISNVATGPNYPYGQGGAIRVYVAYKFAITNSYFRLNSDAPTPLGGVLELGALIAPRATFIDCRFSENSSPAFHNMGNSDIGGIGEIYLQCCNANGCFEGTVSAGHRTTDAIVDQCV